MTRHRKAPLAVATLGVALGVSLAAAGSLRHAQPAANVMVPAGATNPAVDQGTISTTICVSGWTATVRPPAAYTGKLKRDQIAQRHLADTNPTHYEEDHFVPLELGGAPSDPNNLWPERQPQASRTDLEENRLHRAVCAGQESLAQAQAEIVRYKATNG